VLEVRGVDLLECLLIDPRQAWCNERGHGRRLLQVTVELFLGATLRCLLHRPPRQL
jgi:hypothetical protein